MMKWNLLLGGVCIGLGFGIFIGGALVELTGKWNSSSSAGVGIILAITGVIAVQRERLARKAEKPSSN